LHQMQHSAVRVNTRCLRRSVRRCGALSLPERRAAMVTWDFMIPPGPDATMMRLMPLRGVHHRCACWHRDASGYIRRITGGPGERCLAGAAAARDAPSLRITGHLTRLTWQPAAHVAPHASRAWRQTSPQPPARRSATRPADARRHAADVAGTHRSRRPVEAPDLALLRSPGDPYGSHQPGRAPRAPRSG
jgi:hypothetical protein